MNKYKTTKECRDLTGIETPDLVKLCKDGNVDYYTVPESKYKYRINVDSLMQYLNNNNVPSGAFRNITLGTYTLVGGYDHQYAINNDTGEIVNFDNGRILTPSPNRTEDNHNGKVYYQVALMKDGKRILKLIHRLELEAGLLPNNRGCDNVHHINGKSEDNRPSNLLPTFSGEEHSTLDRLRKDKTKKKEYMRMIKEIKKLNSEELFKIPHPDYPSDEHTNYFMLLNKKGYQTYKQGKEIPLDSIRCESMETIKGEIKAE